MHPPSPHGTLHDTPPAGALSEIGLPRLQNPKAHEAYLRLHSAITHGRYSPGTRLKEMDLAASLHMSRTPIREAIRQLQRDGMVTVLPNRGAVVRTLNAQEIDDTYSLRAVLEGYSASRAATRLEAGALAHLEEVNDLFERAVHAYDSATNDVDGLIRLNRAFHEAIAIGSNNHRVTDFLQRAIEIPAHLKRLYWRSDRARQGAVLHHQEILEALLARDPMRADAAMRTHVYSVKDFYMREQRVAGLQRLLDHASAPEQVMNLSNSSDLTGNGESPE